jgi:hypothetical protein
MTLQCLASFQDSRTKPRKATSTAQTYRQTITDVPVSIRPSNDNRTYLTLRNESLGDDLRYAYNIADLPLQGFLLRFGETVDIESPQEIFAVANVALKIIDICMDEGNG